MSIFWWDVITGYNFQHPGGSHFSADEWTVPEDSHLLVWPQDHFGAGFRMWKNLSKNIWKNIQHIETKGKKNKPKTLPQGEKWLKEKKKLLRWTPSLLWFLWLALLLGLCAEVDCSYQQMHHGHPIPRDFLRIDTKPESTWTTCCV